MLSYRRIYALAGLTSRVSGMYSRAPNSLLVVEIRLAGLLTMLKKRGGRGGDDEGEVEMMVSTVLLGN